MPDGPVRRPLPANVDKMLKTQLTRWVLMESDDEAAAPPSTTAAAAVAGGAGEPAGPKITRGQRTRRHKTGHAH